MYSLLSYLCCLCLICPQLAAASPQINTKIQHRNRPQKENKTHPSHKQRETPPAQRLPAWAVRVDQLQQLPAGPGEAA
eukprot:1158325-Pelagomonas_calceolata.AAC.1